MDGRYQKYSEYKDSGIEWLEKIPEHWNMKKLKFLAKVQPSNIDKKSKDSELPIALCNYTDVYYNEFVDNSLEFMKATATKEQIDKFTLKAGDIIITKDSEDPNDIAVPTFVPVNMPGVVCGYHLAMIRPFLMAYGAYIRRFFECTYARSYFATRSNGLTRYGLGTYALENVYVPQPPRSEVAVLAEFLDHETAKIDTLIEKQQQIIKLLKEKRQAVISHAVTKGLNPDTPMRDSGIEWLGQVPAHWNVIELKFSAEDGRKKFVDGDWIERLFITESGVRLIQTGNVGIGEYREQGFKFISESSFEALKCTEIVPDDLLICRLDGPVGRACLVPNLGVKMITSVDNAILKSSEKFEPRFLVHLMSSTPWLDWIQNLCRAGGGFRFRISRTMLGGQRIPVPPISEQVNISDYLDKQIKHSQECIKKSEESINLLSERRTALISAAVTGKIDIRNWQPLADNETNEEGEE